MKNKNILISGAGIAGPCLAYWLCYYGFNPTIVEMYPKIREGGYIIDFWGVGYDVAEKMDIIDQLKIKSYSMEELVFVGDRGKQKGGINLQESTRILDGRMLSFLRSDLSKILYDTSKESTHYIFDESINSIEQTENDIVITFKSGKERRFDLLIGADGLHSKVRSLCFGDEKRFEHFFGYYVATFTIDNFLGESFLSKYTMYSMPDKQVSLYSLRENKLSIFFIFKHPESLLHLDIDAKKEMLRTVFKDKQWLCKEFLEKMDSATDFYFDSVSQIVMDSWSSGRVCLVGDAAYCPSLLSGQGAALAMAGAYVLAGELYQAGGDHQVAFEQYQQIFKPFADKKQGTAKRFIRSFVPSSHFKIWFRNQSSRFFKIPFISNLYWKKFLIDPIVLKNYELS